MSRSRQGFFVHGDPKGEKNMPDWTAPFHRPKMTTDEFKLMKAKYIAEHGYTMTVPGLDDIIKINFEKAMTDQEVKDWKNRNYDKFPPERYEAIKAMKAKRKEKFLAMLGSPTPHIVNNAGSIMTSIDDAQDALSTLAMVGVLAIKAAPRVLGKVFSGPVGWTLAGSDVLNTVAHLGFKKMPNMTSKRQIEAATGENLRTKKGRLKAIKKLGLKFPTKAAAIEGLQVTENIFGVGICLGPIVGFVIEAVTGPYRVITGEPVRVKLPVPSVSTLTKIGQIVQRSSIPYFASDLQTSNEEVLSMMIAYYLSCQELLTMQSGWSALDQVENLEDVELLAPTPKHILTREVIEEEGLNIDDVVGWPHNSKPWALTGDIANELETPAKKFVQDYMALHEHDWWGYAFSSLATGATFHQMGNLEEESAVVYDYTAPSKAGMILCQFGKYPDPDQSAEKIAMLADQIDFWEATGEKPTFLGITEFCENKGIILSSFET